MTKHTRYDKEMLSIIMDPVKWAKHHLGGDEPRWYQEEILRHPHNRKVLRCGRRIGKCIEGTQRILDPSSGAYRSVEELFYMQKQKEEPVRLTTLDESYRLVPSEALFIEDNGMKETFRVRTKHGAEVVLTGNHPVLTIDGWVEVDALDVGSHIAVPKGLRHEGEGLSPTKEGFALEEAYLLGVVAATGRLRGGQVHIESRFENVAEYTMHLTGELDGKASKVESKKQSYRLLLPEPLQEKALAVISEREQGRMPEVAYGLKRDELIAFLSGLYDAGGWDYAKRIVEIGYGTTSRQFAKDLKHLLLRLGLKANLLEKQVSGKPYFQVMVYYREHVLGFIEWMESTGMSVKDYSWTKTRALEMSPGDYRLPKEVWPYIEKERREKKLTRTAVTGKKTERFTPDRAIGYQKAARYAEVLESAFIHDLVHGDVFWEEVVAIDAIGERQTYDVFVPETHNLVVEDILVHNTWTMTAHMLWVAYTCNGGTETKKGATCLVATPYDTQAREIFDQLINFIENNEALQASVETTRRNPYEIVFKNKSRIKLYTAGSRSGAEGGNMRGQKASWLYLDEADYLTDKDFEAIYAITLEAPKRIGVMMASTPTGRRGKFYQACKELKFNQEDDLKPIKTKEGMHFDARKYDRMAAEGWKEFHFPTMVNPEWSPSMERELRLQYENDAYGREVLAEFGAEMAGVFNKDFIDEASSSGYGYSERRMNANPIAIGVDWDKAAAATQIVVTEWDPLQKRADHQEYLRDQLPELGRFKVINRVEIPVSEFTYDNAVKKLQELDKRYNPFAIYVDKGAGDYQSEILRKTIGEKVKAIAFGSAETVRDPVSRQLDKKPLKAFMVSMTNLLLERGQLRIPNAYDDSGNHWDEMLKRQMTNYVIKKISATTGQPTFTNVDEHALDAFMLTLYAFNKEMPKLANALVTRDPVRKMETVKQDYVDPLKHLFQEEAFSSDKKAEWDEPGQPPMRRVGIGSKPKRDKKPDAWGTRGHASFKGRSHF